MKLPLYNLQKIAPGTRVLMRLDLNLTFTGKQIEKEAQLKIKAVTAEVKALSRRGARVILMSHLGRPQGKRRVQDSLRSVVKILIRDLKHPVKFCPDAIGARAQEMIEKMKPGEVLLLENLRFYPGEEKNDAKFAQELAQLGDIYINDAFSASHRAHASLSAITKYLPSYAGKLLKLEVTELSKPLPSPLTLVIGGIKLETKVELIEALFDETRLILVGGGPAVALLSVMINKKLSAGSVDLTQNDLVLAKQVMEKAGKKIILPIDFQVSKLKSGKNSRLKTLNELCPGDRVFDIGPESARLFAEHLPGAGSIVWNGPVGAIEDKVFAFGTLKLAKAITQIKSARKITGGGDTIGFLAKNKLFSKFDYVSLGGGAMLTFLSGEPMPGLIALKKE